MVEHRTHNPVKKVRFPLSVLKTIHKMKTYKATYYSISEHLNMLQLPTRSRAIGDNKPMIEKDL